MSRRTWFGRAIACLGAPAALYADGKDGDQYEIKSGKESEALLTRVGEEGAGLDRLDVNLQFFDEITFRRGPLKVRINRLDLWDLLQVKA